MKKNRKKLKWLLIAGFVGFLIYLISTVNIYDKESLIDFFTTAKVSTNFGMFFTIATAVLVVFFVPISWLNAFGAFFFGLKGFIYIFIGGIVGSIASFYIARVFQDDVMKIVYKIYNRKKRKVSLDEVKGKIEKFGIGYVFFLRSMPFIPFSVANFVSGVTSIKFRDYILGTILGLGPGQFITTFFFSRAVNLKEDPIGAIIGASIKIIYVGIVILWQKNSKFKSKE